jgi:hypothetical protein
MDGEKRDDNTQCTGEVGGDPNKSFELEHLANILLRCIDNRKGQMYKRYITKCFGLGFLAGLQESL